MLNLNNLHFAYKQEEVISNLSLQLEPGKIHGLVGLNGSGKSTLFSLIYRLLTPQQGEISWNNRPLIRQDMSLLDTQNFFYTKITGQEYLNLFQSEKGSFDDRKWAELFELPLSEYVEGYSTGMKKKLALMGIIKQDRELMLLDEPFNGVDMETARVIQLLLSKLAEQGKTLLITSHILETLKSCDFIHILRDKQIQTSYDTSKNEDLDQLVFEEVDEQTKNQLKELF